MKHIVLAAGLLLAAFSASAAARPQVLGSPKKIYASYFNVAKFVYDERFAIPDTESVLPKFVFHTAESNDYPAVRSSPTASLPVLARIPGLRNVRDIGGWTGLRRGMVWRGSALAWGKDGPTDEERETARYAICDVLKLKTDLDLRGGEERLKDREGRPKPNLQEFGVGLAHVGLGGYLGAFGGGTNAYRRAMLVFANPTNFPVYVHCAGGADRTGTLIFILEALCGVSERDLAIDYELTSFAKIYNIRQRNSVGSLCYKKMMDRFRADYPGATINEKVEAYARRSLGLTDADIAAIRANLRAEEPEVPAKGPALAVFGGSFSVIKASQVAKREWKRVLGCTVKDYGIGGCGFEAGRAKGNDVAGQVARALASGEKYDCFVLWASGNDVRFPVEKQEEGIERAVKLIRAKAPDAKIVLFTSLPEPFRSQDVQVRLRALASSQIKMCEQLGVACLDLNTRSGITVDNGRPLVQKDNCHMTEAGYDFIKGLQTDFLKAQFQ